MAQNIRDKKILVIAILVIVALGASFIYTRISKDTDVANNQNDPTTMNQSGDAEANANAKKQVIENEEDQPDSSETYAEKSIELTPKTEQNATVTIFTKLTKYSDGDCKLTIKNGNREIQYSAKVIFQREFSSCAGFSVPIESLGAGKWTISLSVTSDERTETKIVTHEVN